MRLWPFGFVSTSLLSVLLVNLKPGLYQTVALFGQSISMMVIFLAQTNFVVNLTFAVVRFQNINPSP